MYRHIDSIKVKEPQTVLKHSRKCHNDATGGNEDKIYYSRMRKRNIEYRQKKERKERRGRGRKEESLIRNYSNHKTVEEISLHL